jgi:hypothetical protein
MRLSPVAMAVSFALLGGSALLFVGFLNLIFPTYGTAFLAIASSVYPWFHGSGTIRDVLMGTVDGFIDGGIAGFLLAWFYNLASRQSKPA